MESAFPGSGLSMAILPSRSLLLGDSHFVLIQVSVWCNGILHSPSPFWNFLWTPLEIPDSTSLCSEVRNTGCGGDSTVESCCPLHKCSWAASSVRQGEMCLLVKREKMSIHKAPGALRPPFPLHQCPHISSAGLYLAF